MPVSPARAAAFEILLRVERDQAYASELLHAPARQELSSADHRLMTELVMGVLRWRSRLDDELARASSKKLERLDPEVLTALRLAAYQLGWLDRIPARAALHESVEMVKRARKRSAVPFVNAVLRKLDVASLSPAAAADGSSAGTLAANFAHPAWLVERWADHYGLAAAQSICRHDQQAPGIAIRRPTTEVEAALAASGVTLHPGSLVRSAARISEGDLAASPAFRQGRVFVQDEASQLVAVLAGAGRRILDCCAAPGGKTGILAERNPGAEIVASDLYPHRARLLQTLSSRSGARVHIVAADALHLPLAGGFNLVLADVPCSGTGTLARHPEIKWRLGPGDLANLRSLQQAILRSALRQLAPGGRLLYSTCSLEPEENEQVIEAVLRDSPGLRLLPCRAELEALQKSGDLAWTDLESLLAGPYLRTIPGVHPCDGFFAAVLQRP